MTVRDSVNRDGDIAATGEQLGSVGPRTGAIVVRFPIDGQPAVDAAIGRARAVAGWWCDEGVDGRGRQLLRWRAEIARGADELVDLIHRENGKTGDAARVGLVTCLDLIGWAVANAPRVLAGRDVPTRSATSTRASSTDPTASSASSAPGTARPQPDCAGTRAATREDYHHGKGQSTAGIGSRAP